MANFTMTNSSARGSAGRLAAIALAGTLAAFGCTTYLNPGSGDPTGVGPSSPTSTPGTSYGGGNVPMASAYNAGSAGTLSGGNPPMISAYLASDPANSRREYQTKYLGRSDPAPSGTVVVDNPNT